MKNAQYRKYNDRSHNSSTYHKKDGTSIRTLLKRDAESQIKESHMEKRFYIVTHCAVEDFSEVASPSVEIDTVKIYKIVGDDLVFDEMFTEVDDEDDIEGFLNNTYGKYEWREI